MTREQIAKYALQVTMSHSTDEIELHVSGALPASYQTKVIRSFCIRVCDTVRGSIE